MPISTYFGWYFEYLGKFPYMHFVAYTCLNWYIYANPGIDTCRYMQLGAYICMHTNYKNDMQTYH